MSKQQAKDEMHRGLVEDHLRTAAEHMASARHLAESWPTRPQSLLTEAYQAELAIRRTLLAAEQR